MNPRFWFAERYRCRHSAELAVAIGALQSENPAPFWISIRSEAFRHQVVRSLESCAHSRNERKMVETLFGHMKRILKLDRLRLRGITGASDEFVIVAAVRNLRRLAQWRGHGPRLAPIQISI